MLGATLTYRRDMDVNARYLTFGMACLFLSISGVSLAGLTHVGSSLVCSDCHSMHYSMRHNYRGGATDLVTDANGPFGNLLKASPNELCLACHDQTSFAPDVLGEPSNDYVRQAGALNRLGVEESGYKSWTGHTLESTDVAPGGTWSNSTTGLRCTDCHAPHGIPTQFRNLWTDSAAGHNFENKTLTYAYGATNDTNKDVFLHDGFDVAYRYGVLGTDFNEPDETKSAYANWCRSCHTNFHGASGGSEVGGVSGGDTGGSEGVAWVRHPNADTNIGAHDAEMSSLAEFQSHANRAKVMSHSGTWASAADVTPSCFSCHKAHGNKNAFALIYMSGSGTVTEEGDTGGSHSVRDLCRQCHEQ